MDYSNRSTGIELPCRVRVADVARWALSRGRPQVFLDAAPRGRGPSPGPPAERRRWALRQLYRSPHYFLDRHAPQFAGLSLDDYLEAEARRQADVRRRIFDVLFAPLLVDAPTVLDYGCGPGFLANAAAVRARRVYACDISPGAIACARAIGGRDNLTFHVADDAGLAQIPDHSVDLVVCLAVVQHITDQALDDVLSLWRNKLVRGGRVACQVQLLTPPWRTEAEWRADRSLRGRLRWRFGLHCFGRTEADLVAAWTRHGFAAPTIADVSSRIAEHGDPTVTHLLTAIAQG